MLPVNSTSPCASTRRRLRPLHALALLLGLAAFPVHHASAADGTWISNADGNWGDPANWQNGDIASGAGFTADLNTVNLTANRTLTLETTYTIGNLTLGDANNATPFAYIIGNGGNAANTLTLSGTNPTITVNTSGTSSVPHTISAVVGGSNGLSVTGPGALLLNGANTFTGGLSISGGATFWALNNASFGDSANSISLNGGTIRTATSSNTTYGTGRQLILGASGGTIQSAGSFVQQIIAADISETTAGTALNITGAGQITLSGVNTYTGGTVVNGARLFFSNMDALPDTGLILINQGGTLVTQSGAFATINSALPFVDTASTGTVALNGNSTSTPVNMNVDFTGYSGLFLGSNSETNYTGTLTPDGTTYRLGGGSSNLRMGAVNQLTDVDDVTSRNLIVGTGSGANSNVIMFMNSNTFSGGTAINGGGVASLYDSAGLGTGAITVNTGRLQLYGGINVANDINLAGDNSTGSFRNMTGENTHSGTVTVLANSRITTENVAGNILNLTDVDLQAGTLSVIAGGTTGGDVNVTGTISGAGNVSKSGGATMTITGDNSFTGNYGISAGTLALGSDTALGSGSGTLNISGTSTIRSSSTATRTVSKSLGAMTGSNSTFSFGSDNSAQNGNLIFSSAGSSATSNTRTLQVLNTTTFNTVFTGSGGFIKTGAGTLLLNGASTRTGSTVVNEGTLGGTGTVAALTINTATLAPGNSIGTLNAANTLLSGTSTYSVELGADAGTPGLIYSDRLNVNGTVTIASGANLQLTLYDGLVNPQAGDLFFIVSNNLVDAISGEFTQFNGVATDLSQGAFVTWGDIEFQISYTANFEGEQTFTGGNDIALLITDVVPEPGSAALVLGTLGVVAMLRRRRV